MSTSEHRYFFAQPAPKFHRWRPKSDSPQTISPTIRKYRRTINSARRLPLDLACFLRHRPVLYKACGWRAREVQPDGLFHNGLVRDAVLFCTKMAFRAFDSLAHAGLRRWQRNPWRDWVCLYVGLHVHTNCGRFDFRPLWKKTCDPLRYIRVFRPHRGFRLREHCEPAFLEPFFHGHGRGILFCPAHCLYSGALSGKARLLPGPPDVRFCNGLVCRSGRRGLAPRSYGHLAKRVPGHRISRVSSCLFCSGGCGRM